MGLDAPLVPGSSAEKADVCCVFPTPLAAVAINLIVQHIQDILNGDICKWQRGAVNGHGRTYKRPFSEQAESSSVLAAGKRSHLESSSRPH